MKFQKLTSALCAVCMMITVIPGELSVSAETCCSYVYTALSSDEQEIYDKFLISCLKVENSSDTYETIPEITTRKFTVDELVTLSSVFVFDHPEFFWISPSYTASSGGKNVSFSLKLYDQYQDGTARETARKEIEEIEQGYINQALTYATDYDRAKYLAQALAEDITFGYGENNIDQSIASAFLDKKTVCAGYAKAYSLLCNSVGVDTITELSLVHGWNAVRIADNWYNVDVNQKLFLYSDGELSAHDENGKLYTATDENGNEFTFHMHDVYDGYYTFALPDTSQSL